MKSEYKYRRSRSDEHLDPNYARFGVFRHVITARPADSGSAVADLSSTATDFATSARR
jgi:hypothetical protein